MSSKFTILQKSKVKKAEVVTEDSEEGGCLKCRKDSDHKKVSSILHTYIHPAHTPNNDFIHT